ncbi:hypothetical protein G1C94_0809 [Bifidobacterium sp. DSM 109963]|uniref:Transposase n=1 Tax=Bifidobacterium panos TaxID=2675321 RepID=A0ABX1SYC5_9BIFI|nr:hypothetical protein [Bifidobacterium sp. DSM 109963]
MRPTLANRNDAQPTALCEPMIGCETYHANADKSYG